MTTTTKPTMDELPQAIRDLPCEKSGYTYSRGFGDACHAAAELVIETMAAERERLNVDSSSCSSAALSWCYVDRRCADMLERLAAKPQHPLPDDIRSFLERLAVEAEHAGPGQKAMMQDAETIIRGLVVRDSFNEYERNRAMSNRERQCNTPDLLRDFEATVSAMKPTPDHTDLCRRIVERLQVDPHVGLHADVALLRECLVALGGTPTPTEGEQLRRVIGSVCGEGFASTIPAADMEEIAVRWRAAWAKFEEQST